MNDCLILVNARVPGTIGLHQIMIQQGVIASVQPQALPSPTLSPSTGKAQQPTVTHRLDMAGDWVSLGGVDLQINGALGLAFPDLNPANSPQLAKIGEFLWQQGVDGYLPTLVTTTVDKIQRSLAAIANFQNQRSTSTPPSSATILGVHLEGPFLNPAKRGAHPEAHLVPLTLENVKRVLGDYVGLIKVITLAPELDPSGECISYLRSLGIAVSLGHSLATAAQAQRAFDQGATLVTHAFNAMPALHHRDPGLLGAAIVHPRVHCGLIADGQHVAPVMIDILLRACHAQQGVFLVSDALAPLGLPDGLYPWDTRQIEVQQGTARLLDGTLSGTTLSLLVGVKNLVRWGLCAEESAIALATTAPRQALGLPTELIGQPAHLLRWHSANSGELEWERIVLTNRDRSAV